MDVYGFMLINYQPIHYYQIFISLPALVFLLSDSLNIQLSVTGWKSRVLKGTRNNLFLLFELEHF